MPCRITTGVMMMRSERPNSPRGNRRFSTRKGWSCAIALRHAIRHEHVANAAHGLNVERQLRVFLDLAPQPRHLHIDGALETYAEPRAEVGAREGPARIRREQLQQRR